MVIFDSKRDPLLTWRAFSSISNWELCPWQIPFQLQRQCCICMTYSILQQWCCFVSRPRLPAVDWEAAATVYVQHPTSFQHNHILRGSLPSQHSVHWRSKRFPALQLHNSSPAPKRPRDELLLTLTWLTGGRSADLSTTTGGGQLAQLKPPTPALRGCAADGTGWQRTCRRQKDCQC